MPRRIFGPRVNAAQFLISEANEQRSRGQQVLAPDAVNLRKSGTPLGKLTANGQLTPYNPAGADGSQNFEAFLFDDVPESATATRITTVERDCEVNGWLLVYPNGALTAPQKTAFEAAAAAKGCIVRY